MNPADPLRSTAYNCAARPGRLASSELPSVESLLALLLDSLPLSLAAIVSLRRRHQPRGFSRHPRARERGIATSVRHSRDQSPATVRIATGELIREGASHQRRDRPVIGVPVPTARRAALARKRESLFPVEELKSFLLLVR